MADPEKGLWERLNFNDVLKFLKSYRILIAYDLTRNKRPNLYKLKLLCLLLISKNMSILCHFRGCVGGGDMTEFGPFGSSFKSHGSPPQVTWYMRIPPEFKRKDDVSTEYFQKVHANSSLHR